MLTKITDIISCSNALPLQNIQNKSTHGTQIQSRCTSVPSEYKRLSIFNVLNEQIRQNQLQWMFNRRKQKLMQTSVQNLKLYKRINNQKSSLSKYNKTKLKPLNYKIGLNLVGLHNKQNVNIVNQLKKRNQQVTQILHQAIPKQWKKFNHQTFKII